MRDVSATITQHLTHYIYSCSRHLSKATYKWESITHFVKKLDSNCSLPSCVVCKQRPGENEQHKIRHRGFIKYLKLLNSRQLEVCQVYAEQVCFQLFFHSIGEEQPNKHTMLSQLSHLFNRIVTMWIEGWCFYVVPCTLSQRSNNVYKRILHKPNTAILTAVKSF